MILYIIPYFSEASNWYIGLILYSLSILISVLEYINIYKQNTFRHKYSHKYKALGKIGSFLELAHPHLPSVGEKERLKKNILP